MRFPELLWSLVNECKSGAIAWSEDGDSIIFDYLKFKEEYMMNMELFKATNIASFIRQLNLYGFRKCQILNKNGINLHEFCHPMFVRGRRDLLKNLKRRQCSSTEDKLYCKPSKSHKDIMGKYQNLKKLNKKRTFKREASSSEADTTDNLPISVGYAQPTSSMEQMQRFMFSNPLVGSNIANRNMNDFSVSQSWINPSFFYPRNWINNAPGGPWIWDINGLGGIGSWSSNVPKDTVNSNVLEGSGTCKGNVPGSTENCYFNGKGDFSNVSGGNSKSNVPGGAGTCKGKVPGTTGNCNHDGPGDFRTCSSNVSGGNSKSNALGNWNSKLPGFAGNNENYYNNLIRGYPVLQPGDDGKTHYLVMRYSPYGAMYQNPNLYMNTMPISGMPIEK